MLSLWSFCKGAGGGEGFTSCVHLGRSSETVFGNGRPTWKKSGWTSVDQIEAESSDLYRQLKPRLSQGQRHTFVTHNLLAHSTKLLSKTVWRKEKTLHSQRKDFVAALCTFNASNARKYISFSYEKTQLLQRLIWSNVYSSGKVCNYSLYFFSLSFFSAVISRFCYKLQEGYWRFQSNLKVCLLKFSLTNLSHFTIEICPFSCIVTLLPGSARDGEAGREISDADKLNGLMFNCPGWELV